VSNKSLYPTFVRTVPPATQVSKSIVAFLRHHGWRRFTLIAGLDVKWKSIADKTEELAVADNMTINDRHNYNDAYTSTTTANPFHDIVSRTYVHTRGTICLID
jgi:guanylate cyclase